MVLTKKKKQLLNLNTEIQLEPILAHYYLKNTAVIQITATILVRLKITHITCDIVTLVTQPMDTDHN